MTIPSSFNLLNNDWAKQFLQAKIVEPFYPGEKITTIRIFPIKKHWRQTHWHLVVLFALTARAKIRRLFFTGHSDQSRLATFNKQAYLYRQAFDRGPYRVTKPLLYYPPLRGMFYEAITGQNMYSAIKANSRRLPHALKQTAGWLSKLHKLPKPKKRNPFSPFALTNKLLDPGINLPLIKKRRPGLYKKLYQLASTTEKRLHQLPRPARQTIIHGDLHPQNIFLLPQSVMVIDYTDLAIGDPIYDLGSFIQQFGFMAKGFMPAKTIYSRLLTFINHYLKLQKITLTSAEVTRLNYYQAWLAIKSAIYYAAIPGTAQHQKNVDYLINQADEFLAAKPQANSEPLIKI